MYEVSVINQEKVGIGSVEIVEHIFVCRSAIAAERLAAKLKAEGFSFRVRRFETEPFFPGDEEKIVQQLRKMEV